MTFILGNPVKTNTPPRNRPGFIIIVDIREVINPFINYLRNQILNDGKFLDNMLDEYIHWLLAHLLEKYTHCDVINFDRYNKYYSPMYSQLCKDIGGELDRVFLNHMSSIIGSGLQGKVIKIMHNGISLFITQTENYNLFRD